MARDGSGSYSRAVAAYQAGQTISSTAVNAEMDDVAAALTASLAKDGQTVPTANLPMGGFKHTGVAAGSGAARNEYPSTATVQDGGPWWCGTAGGSANAITLAPTPAIASYTAGQRFQFIAASNNTNTVTVAVSGLGTKAIQKGAAALASGDIDSGKTYEIIYDGTAFQLSEYDLGQPPVAGSGIGVSGSTVSLNISGLTEDTSPEASADFVATYDNSATANKKVLLSRLSGPVKQIVTAAVSTTATATTLMVNDDTIPQSSEGDEILTANITLTGASNKVLVRVNVFGASGANRDYIMAVFRGGTDAIAATTQVMNGWGQIGIEFTDTPGSAGPHTYSVRLGPTVGDTFTVNGVSASRRLGGVAKSVIVLEEYA